MQQSKTVSDDTLTRLRMLTIRLTEQLVEAQDVRTRFQKAHDANVWPDMELACKILMDASRRAH